MIPAKYGRSVFHNHLNDIMNEEDIPVLDLSEGEFNQQDYFSRCCQGIEHNFLIFPFILINLALDEHP